MLLRALTDSEIGDMLSSIAWRKVRSMLMKELEERQELGTMKEIVALEFQSSCAVLKRKSPNKGETAVCGSTIFVLG